MTLDISRLRLGDSKYRIKNFMDGNMVQVAEETMLTTAQKLAWNRGLSENAISAMYIERVEYMKWDFIWDYRGPKNEPISLFLNDGTDAHDIEALGKDFGGADMLSWVDKFGKRVFRPKVRHPGTTGMKIKENAWKQSKGDFTRKMRKLVEDYMELTGLGR
jgi:hypothetical protein